MTKSRTLALIGTIAAGTLLVGYTAQADPGSDAAPRSRTSRLESVSPALAKYDRERVQQLWNEDGLSRRDRGLVTIAVLISNGQTTELGRFTDRALDDGLSAAEISETVTHLAFYTGWQNAKAAVPVIAEVFDEHGIDADQLPERDPDLLPQDQEAERAREKSVQEDYGGVSQGVVDDTDDVLFDDLWLRPALKPRDRSLITVVALISSSQRDQITFHLNRAMDSGITDGEVDALLNHVAYFAGWPKVFTAMPVIRDVLESR
ncbi:4-carboxymuconolactone decarboxylase [Streptomyces sp. SA15]|uniref:carboxymuconolactone decarboxylase family protein n=1 Tax=Streptomyces sp. SA15 TaxID=934019 RepID=UPI000BB0B001|nr:carboxymuconolactone decarboxylase family protein [Streptomyces sp. SA15]PAZ16033.1 4-carboxymuconolactone decarboxylase [Streptomyces sp. SA15]